MNLQVGGPTNTIVLTKNRTGVTLIMDLTLYQLDHASMSLMPKLKKPLNLNQPANKFGAQN